MKRLFRATRPIFNLREKDVCSEKTILLYVKLYVFRPNPHQKDASRFIVKEINSARCVMSASPRSRYHPKYYIEQYEIYDNQEESLNMLQKKEA